MEEHAREEKKDTVYVRVCVALEESGLSFTISSFQIDRHAI